MGAKFRARLTFANVVSVMALFIAIGGSSYAAISVTGKNVKNSSLTGKDVKNNSLTGKDVKSLASGDVKNFSLLSKDFKPGQLPAGPRGAQGAPGIPATRMYGVFDGTDGSQEAGTGIADSSRQGLGVYYITFNRDVSDCVFVASPSSIDATNPSSRTVGAAPGPLSNQAFVLVRKDFADTRSDDDFSLAVFC
jgi:hypothetical protein